MFAWANKPTEQLSIAPLVRRGYASQMLNANAGRAIFLTIAHAFRCVLLGLCLTQFAQAAPWNLFGQAPENAQAAILVFQATGDGVADSAWPQSAAALAGWQRQQQRVAAVDMLGGDFWLLTSFQPQRTADYVVVPGNTFFARADVRVYRDVRLRAGATTAGAVQRGAVGIGVSNTNALHRVVALHLSAGERYQILVRMRTPFFTSLPRVDIYPGDVFTQRMRNETLLTLMALGCLLALGIFNGLIGVWARDASYILYGGQALSLFMGWAFYFNVPYEWLGVSSARINFAPFFFLLTAFHSAFCSKFFELKLRSKLLHRIGRVITISALLLLPVCFLQPMLSHLLATLWVGQAIVFALCAGIWALLQGDRKARFFVAGYLTILLPGLLILPANLGLMPDVVDNADLLVLIGNAAEAMLLALALADRVKMIERSREEFRLGMQIALSQASTDGLTGLANRYAFNMELETILLAGAGAGPGKGLREGPVRSVTIAMIDLDGLKQINDSLGHAAGDALIQAAAKTLAGLDIKQLHSYRLGGDEFALLLHVSDDLSKQRLQLEILRAENTLRANGFAAAGLSFGIASSAEKGVLDGARLNETLKLADQRMYAYKSQRRHRTAPTLVYPKPF